MPVPDPGPRVNNLLQYELDFFRALATFRHQVVYDPITCSTVHLEPVIFSELPLCLQFLVPASQQGDPASVSHCLSFVGELLEPAVAQGIAEGLLDPVTHKAFVLEGDGAQKSSAKAVLREMAAADGGLAGPAAAKPGKVKATAKKDARGRPSQVTQIHKNSIQRFLANASASAQSADQHAKEAVTAATMSAVSNSLQPPSAGPRGMIKRPSPTKRKATMEEEGEGEEEETLASYLVASRKRANNASSPIDKQPIAVGRVIKANNSKFFSSTRSVSTFGGKSTATLLREHEERQRHIAAERLRQLSPSPKREFQGLGLDAFAAPPQPPLRRSPRKSPANDFYDQSENLPFFETSTSNTTQGSGSLLFDDFGTMACETRVLIIMSLRRLLKQL